MQDNFNPNGADVQITGSSDSADRALLRTITLIDDFNKKVKDAKKTVDDFNIAYKMLRGLSNKPAGTQWVQDLDRSLGNLKNSDALQSLNELAQNSQNLSNINIRGNQSSPPNPQKENENTKLVDMERKRLELDRRREQINQTQRKIEMSQSLESAKNLRALVSHSKDLMSAFSSGQGFGKLMVSSFSMANRGLESYSNYSSGVTNYINNEAGSMLMARGNRPLRAPSNNTQFPNYRGAPSAGGAAGRAGASAMAGVGGSILVGGAVLIGALALVGAMGALGKKGQEAELKIAKAYTVMSDNFDDAFDSVQKYNSELGVSESRIASLIASTAKLTSSQGFNAGQSAKMAQSSAQLAMAISQATGDNLEEVSAKVEQYLQGQDSLQEYNIRAGGAKAFGDAQGITSVNAQLSEAKASLLQMQYAIFQFNEGALASVQPANELQQKWEAIKSTLNSTGEKLYRLFLPVFELLVDVGYGIAKGIELAVDQTIKLVEAFRKFGALVSGKEYKPIDWTQGTGLQQATNNIKDLTAGYQQAQEEIEATQGALFKFDEVNNLSTFDNDLSSLDKLDEVTLGNKKEEDKLTNTLGGIPSKIKTQWSFKEKLTPLLEWILDAWKNALKWSPAFAPTLALASFLKWILNKWKSGKGWEPSFNPKLQLGSILDWMLDTWKSGAKWSPTLAPSLVVASLLKWLLEKWQSGEGWKPNFNLKEAFSETLGWLLDVWKKGAPFTPGFSPTMQLVPLLAWLLNKLFKGEGLEAPLDFKGAEYFNEKVQPAIESAISGVSNLWNETLAGLSKGLDNLEEKVKSMGQGAKDALYEPVTQFIQYIKDILNQIGESLAQFGSTIWDWVTGIDWGKILDVVANILDVVALIGVGAAVFTGGTSGAVGAGAKGLATGARGLSLAHKGYKAYKTADKATDAAGVAKFLNGVPSYDTGGIALKPHIAQIGMSGGELALPLHSKVADPAYQAIASNLMERMGSGGGSSPNYTFEIHIASGGNVIADNYSVKRFSDTIATQVEQRLKQTGVFSQGVRR